MGGGIFIRFEDLVGNSFVLVGRDDFVREIEAERRAAVEKLEAERRIAQELHIAKQVQARLFPQTVRSSKRSNTRAFAFRLVSLAATTTTF
jgi:hypothetical protein